MGIKFGDGKQFSSGKPGRRRRVATPGMGHTPYNPMTGDHATLQTPGVFPFCAMMQVAANDAYINYVICRGFDPRINKFIDYDSGDLENKPGIMVAKPYGKRIQNLYEEGEIYPAFLPTQGGIVSGSGQVVPYTAPSPSDVDWRVGQNPGTATPDDYGHPRTLSAAVEKLTDHNGKEVNWLLIGGPGLSTLVRGQQVGALLTTDASNAVDNLVGMDGMPPPGGSITAYNIHDWRADDNAITWCVWNQEDEQWDMIQVTKAASRVRGQQVGALLTSDTTNGVDNLVGLDGTAPAGTITAYNIHDWSADDNADTRCEWNQEDEQWEMYQVTCPA